MKLCDLTIIEHPSLGKEEAWIISKADAPQVPEELRGTLPVPCVLAGDKMQAKRMLTFLHAIAVLQTSDSFTQQTPVIGLLSDSHPLASLQRALYR